MRNDRPIIELPRLIDVRYNAFEHIPNAIEKLKLDGPAVLIADLQTMKIAGNRIMEILEKNYQISPILIKKATLNEAKKVIEYYQETAANFAIAVGGGSVIDIAKFSSFEHKIPFISVPTVASHDGIASARASLSDSNKRHSLEAHSPFAVIGDVETLAKAPKRFSISGCGDIISNITAVLDWELSNRITGEHLSQYAIALSRMTAKTLMASKDIILKDPIEATDTVLKGLITSSMAMCIAGSSRPASGAEHMISHVLDETAKTPGLHGEQCGISSIISMYFHGGNWQEIKNTLEVIGAPTSATQINISSEEFIHAITAANNVRKDRFTILSSGISKEASEKALVETGIIN